MSEASAEEDKLEKQETVVYLGLGSNLGERKNNLTTAIKMLASKMTMKRVSSFYQTEPISYKDQPPFLNAVCQVITSLSPLELLTLVKGIETSMGRTPSFPNAPRVMDIDILLYGDCVIDIPQLTVPHPRMMERAFVLVPLAELAPFTTHPVSRRTIEDLQNAVDGLDGVQRWHQKKKTEVS